MLTLRLYQSEDFPVVVRLFVEVFSAEPWNDRWRSSPNFID